MTPAQARAPYAGMSMSKSCVFCLAISELFSRRDMREACLPLTVDAEVMLGQLAETDDRPRDIGDDEGDDRVDGAVK